MERYYDVEKRLRQSWTALDQTPIGHPMYRHLSADVDLHAPLRALAERPPSYWTGVSKETINARIYSLVHGAWSALIDTPGDRSLSDRVQLESEWLFRCIITSARAVDGDTDDAAFHALKRSDIQELKHEEKAKEDWGSSFYHTDASGRHLRTPDEMLRDRSSLRYSSYKNELQDLVRDATEFELRRKTRSMSLDPTVDQSVAEDRARFNAHLRIANEGRGRQYLQTKPDMLLQLDNAWLALFRSPRDHKLQEHVQLLTDVGLRNYGPQA
jgi:hypothetical protein